jgi:hypothetical protein
MHAIMTLIRDTAPENKADKTVPPHFKNLFSALQLRRLDCASSAAVVIDMAGPSNSSMVDSPNHLSDDG